MKAIKYAILALCIALAGCATIKVDSGGRLTEYKQSVARTQKTGELVIIDYECNSSCIILLSSGKGLRISKNAKFGVHEVRFSLTPEGYWEPTSKRCNSCTEYEKTLVPECATKLFNNAWNNPNLTYFSGEEVLKACTQIEEYIK
jgi:hypothetical protein